jgi:hypothetical protein
MTLDPPPEPRRRLRWWPWIILALAVFPAVWHVVAFPDDTDPEYPRVVRPTFNRRPPPAYRLAEPGDTIDRVAIYVSSLAIVLSLGALVRARSDPGLRGAAVALAVAALWHASTPGPTFDGWHGLGWRAMFDPTAPAWLRLALAAGAAVLAGVVACGVGLTPTRWAERWRRARSRGVAALTVTAVILAVARQLDVPGVELAGYWPRWALVWALIAYAAVLVRVGPGPRPSWRAAAGAGAVATGLWFALTAGGIWLSWYHRPLERLREVVPGKIFISAMPTGRGLAIAQARHHFKTIINLFPEDTPLRSPRLPEEYRFVARHGLRYVRSPAGVASSDAFLDLTLRLAQDPDAWPILVHCHGCMDRTPAWVGIYQFVVEGKPLGESLRFIERHRGCRPKASVTLLYNRVLPRLAPERAQSDPTVALLARCAEGTVDPYFEQLRAELEQAGANPEVSGRVTVRAGYGDGPPPSLTPRR